MVRLAAWYSPPGRRRVRYTDAEEGAWEVRWADRTESFVARSDVRVCVPTREHPQGRGPSTGAAFLQSGSTCDRVAASSAAPSWPPVGGTAPPAPLAAAPEKGTPAPTRARSPSTCASAGLKIREKLSRWLDASRTVRACSVRRRGQEIARFHPPDGGKQLRAWPRSRAGMASRRRRRAAEPAKFSLKRRSAS